MTVAHHLQEAEAIHQGRNLFDQEVHRPINVRFEKGTS
jgi:hypothetical protein